MQTDVPEASEMGHSMFIPRTVATPSCFVSQLCKGQKRKPLWCKLSRDVEQHTFGVSQSGWRRARSGRSENRGWTGEISRARALRDFHVPRSSWSLGRISGCYSRKKAVPDHSPGRGMALVYGGRWWVHLALCPRSLQLTATPEERAVGAATSTRPRGAHRSGGSRYAGPRRYTQAAWGWGKNLAELGIGICAPVERAKESHFTRSLLSWGLGKYAQVSLVKRHLLKDLEQKKVATPNQTNCNTESPAALEEAKTSRVPGSPKTSPEPHDPGGSLPLTPRVESHSEEEDPPGSGLGWNGRGPRAQSPGRCSVEAVLARKKHRRRPSKRKRHWRPYLELSWAEKQQRDERQSQRASRVREEMFAKGQPVAPYNTTQFLMNDRDPEEPNLDVPQGASHPGSSGESEAGDSDSRGRAHGEFQQRDFSEAYERYHTESLQGRSKQELVRDYLDLERRLSQAEEETRRLQQLRGCTSQQPCRQVEELAAEVERLRTENQRLRQENEMWNREGGRRGGERGT
ncbi:LOW QUALITY PROTEIN: protein HEXIM2 [Delphinus delphis]|uniref:LOW QUALITY PROTEIN: protein HEXIM2 n=1 Tax=Delphinus delphis TaxID=9728 RepID=UPI0028C441F3|nr:LOW QUALITY PROTEIN: protein HEXIM2 [Delphinus delphis]